MRRKIDPRKIVLTTMPKECPECHSIQHCFFNNQTQFDDWDCPVCEGRIEPDEDYISTTKEKTTNGNGENQDEVSPVAEDLPEGQGEQTTSTPLDA